VDHAPSLLTTVDSSIHDLPSLTPGTRALLFVEHPIGHTDPVVIPGSSLRIDQIVPLVTMLSHATIDLTTAEPTAPTLPVRLEGSVPGVRGPLYAVPVFVGREVAGVVVVASDAHLDDTALESLAAAAAARGLTLLRLAAQHSAAARSHVTELVSDVFRTVARSAQLPTVLPVVAAHAARAAGFERCSVLLLDESGVPQVSASQFASGQPDVRLWGAIRSLAETPPAFLDVMQGAVPIFYDAPASEPRLLPATWIRSFGIESVLLVPVEADGEVLGLLALDDTRRRHVSSEQLEAARAIAQACGNAVSTIGLLQDERAALHRSQLVLGTVVQAATQLNTPGVLAVIGEGINKVLGDTATVSFVLEGSRPSNLVVTGIGDGVLDLIDRIMAFDEAHPVGHGSECIVMSRATHPAVLDASVASRVVALPLRRASQDLGWVISFSVEEEHYSDQDLKIVAGIAAQAALSLHTALLLEQERATVMKLQELGELKTQFVASVSHELRTPLTAIIGYTELLLEILDDPTLRTYLDDMRRESTALETLISDLLDTSRLEGGTLRLDINRDDPMHAVREAVDLMEHSYPGRRIEIVVNATTDDVPIDRGRLRQVVTNLIDNAVKYSSEGSPVTIMVDRRSGPRGSFVEITVVDRGPGIPHSQREAVFQRFNRLHVTMEPGTGIGLYLVRALVEAHGGTVHVTDGADGIGSRVVVRLPAG